MPKKKKELTPWEVAKPILRDAYIDGTITDVMRPKDVWELKPEFKAVEYARFRDNFARLKRSIRDHRARAVRDEQRFQHDKRLYTLAKDLEGYWEGSEAQKLLKMDIERKRHTRMAPKLLWKSRPEYQKFSSDKFRGHIHQELRSHRETLYWIVKRKKQKQLKEALKKGQTPNAEDIDFCYDPVLEM